MLVTLAGCQPTYRAVFGAVFAFVFVGAWLLDDYCGKWTAVETVQEEEAGREATPRLQSSDVAMIQGTWFKVGK